MECEIKMDYKRILSPVHGKNNLDIDLEPVEKNINEVQEKMNLKLPKEYVEMLKVCDGGRFHDVYVPCSNEYGQIEYNYLDIIYGVSQRCWNIQSAYEQNLEIIVNEDFRNFISDFMYFANGSGQLYKFQEEGVLPHYIDSEQPDKEQIIQFYSEFNLYSDKLDTIIDKLEHLDNKDQYAQLVFLYKTVKFYKLSFEFATMDGHGNFHFYYENGNNNEPSVWYIYDYSEFYKLAPNFKEFMKMLLVERNGIICGMSEINEVVCLFINRLFTVLSDVEKTVTMEEIIDKVIKNNTGYRIEISEKIRICLTPNEYSDGSGFYEFYYKDYKYILDVGSYNCSEEDTIIFKKEYEEKILAILKEKDFSSLRLLFDIGYHNLLDVTKG